MAAGVCLHKSRRDDHYDCITGGGDGGVSSCVHTKFNLNGPNTMQNSSGIPHTWYIVVPRINRTMRRACNIIGSRVFGDVYFGEKRTYAFRYTSLYLLYDDDDDDDDDKTRCYYDNNILLLLLFVVNFRR